MVKKECKSRVDAFLNLTRTVWSNTDSITQQVLKGERTEKDLGIYMEKGGKAITRAFDDLINCECGGSLVKTGDTGKQPETMAGSLGEYMELWGISKICKKCEKPIGKGEAFDMIYTDMYHPGCSPKKSGGDWKDKYQFECEGIPIKNLTMDETGRFKIIDPGYWDDCTFVCSTCGGKGEVYEEQLGGMAICGDCYGATTVGGFPAMQSWIEEEMKKFTNPTGNPGNPHGEEGERRNVWGPYTQSEAETIAKKMRDAGYQVDIESAGTTFGITAYVVVETGKLTNPTGNPGNPVGKFLTQFQYWVLDESGQRRWTGYLSGYDIEDARNKAMKKEGVTDPKKIHVKGDIEKFSGPTALPIATYKGKKYYVDRRLNELRNVDIPWEVVSPIPEQELSGG